MKDPLSTETSETPQREAGCSAPPCSLFLVIIEDRHCDVQVEPWDDEDAAVNRARSIAKEYCRHDEDYEEEEIADWVFYARYSCESDSVRVVKSEIHSANAQLSDQP